MKRLFSLLILTMLAALLITGCSKDDGVSPVQDPNDQLYGSAQTDQQFFELYAQNDEYSTSDETSMNDGDQPQALDDFSVGKVTIPIRPLRWARFIRSFNRLVTLDSVTADSLAYLTVTKTWEGVLLIAAAYDDTSSVPDTVLRKPFTGQATKRFIFKRIANTAVRWRNWRPVAISLIEGGTTSSSAIAISQVKMLFERGGVPDSITVTDPNSTFLRFRRIFDVQAGEVPDIQGGHEVTMQVTVVSTDPDTDHVVLRYGFSRDGLHRRRMRLHLVSETFDGAAYTRVYQRTYTMHFLRGVFCAAIDANTHSTMFDDAAPVANSWWGVPYVVTQ
jgi:hypothetical protein